jgi:uncharacterized protein YegL
MLLHPDLVKYYGTKDGQPANSGFQTFAVDNVLPPAEKRDKVERLRNEVYFASVKLLESRRSEALVAHELTKDFHQALISYDGSANSRDKITEMIQKMNAGVVQKSVSKYRIYFCLDESGSMSGQPFEELKKAVKAFLEKRISMVSSNGGLCEDIVNIVNYGSVGRIVCEQVSINDNPNDKITFKDGGTDFAAGLNVVLQQMNRHKTQQGYTPVLLFMSDGGCGNGEQEMTTLKAQYPETLVFVIGFSSGCDHNKMNKMAAAGKGQFFFGADGVQLTQQFENISVKISGEVLNL